MTPFLLDVNVLIALLDPGHIHHDQAHTWFAYAGANAWATCPLTENAVMRVLGDARYPNFSGNPAAVAELLAEFVSLPGHRFWPDDISILDRQRFDSSRLLSSGQITDSYLLALAQAHAGQLATLDRRLIPDAVAFDNLIWPTFDTFIWPTLRPLFSLSSGGWCFRGPGGSGALRSGFQDRV